MKIKFGDNSLNLKVDGSLANIDRGPRGYSAYEIAVQEGFVGTEEEWLASLVGPEGKQGKDGERGIQGPRGQQGDKGDKGDIGPQGDKGEKGDAGPQGDKGDRGDTGPQGDKGEKGDTGPSNVLSIGSVTKGDEANATITGESPNQILNLVLPKGDKGEQGEQGVQGIQGVKGDTGEPFTIKKTYSSVAEMNTNFYNMQYGDYVMIASSVEVEDNAKLYTRGQNQWIYITDFSGATGIKGEKGDKGEQGVQGIQGIQGIQGETGEKGDTGNGILSIQKTATAGLVDTYMITFTDGTTTTFDVTNGEDGEVTQAQLDESQAKQDTKIDWLQTLVNQMPTVSGTGTNLSLQDVLNYRLMKFLPQGVSSQDGEPTPTTPVPVNSVTGENSVVLQSANLFDKNSSNWFQTYIGQTSHAISTNTSSTNFKTIYIKCLPNTNYYIKKFVGTGILIMGTTELKPTLGMALNDYTLATAPNSTFLTGENANYLVVQISNNTDINNGYTVEEITNNLSITKGSTAPTIYVEHEKQNYQLSLGSIELNSSPDGTIRDGIVGSSDVSYNLFDGIYYNTYTGGSSPYPYANNSNTRSGIIRVKPNTTYTITKELSSRFRMSEYAEYPVANTSNAISYIFPTNGDNLTSYTLTTSNTTNYLVIQVSNTGEENVKMQLTEGSEVKPYFPYGQVGMWYKREYIGKVVLNGSESLKIADNVLYFNVSPYFKIINPDNNNAFCNYFIYGGTAYNTSNAYGKGNNRFTMNRDGSRIYIRNDELLDLDSWKAWLNTHNTEFCYALETPTDIPITDTTLISQLNDIYNNAHSYNGVTNITTTYEDGNEQMYLDVEALAKGGSTTAETDPIFSASASSGITSSDITNWNGKASTTYVDTAIANAITNTLGGSY